MIIIIIIIIPLTVRGLAKVGEGGHPLPDLNNFIFLKTENILF